MAGGLPGFEGFQQIRGDLVVPGFAGGAGDCRKRVARRWLRWRMTAEPCAPSCVDNLVELVIGTAAATTAKLPSGLRYERLKTITQMFDTLPRTARWIIHGRGCARCSGKGAVTVAGGGFGGHVLAPAQATARIGGAEGINLRQALDLQGQHLFDPASWSRCCWPGRAPGYARC